MESSRLLLSCLHLIPRYPSLGCLLVYLHFSVILDSEGNNVLSIVHEDGELEYTSKTYTLNTPDQLPVTPPLHDMYCFKIPLARFPVQSSQS